MLCTVSLTFIARMRYLDLFIYEILSRFRFVCRVEVTFVRANGDRIKAKGKVGDSLLDVVVNSSIDLDGFGACEGTLTCSTCHVILKQGDYDGLPGS